MTYDQIIKDLKNKIYKPIYLLMGDETYYIDLITNYITEHILSADEKTFNQTILYGKDAEARLVDNAARRYPMMSNYQVVVVKEAQNLKSIEDLVFYCSKPLQSTILVINFKYKTLDKRKKLYKEIENNGIVFESKKLYDYQIPKWIKEYLKKHKYEIDPNAEMLLTEYLGNDLGKISNELDKLIISLPENTTITNDLIEKNIGISKDYNNFELQKALVQKDVLKANRIINYFGQNQRDNPIATTIPSLFYFFSKVLAYHYIPDKSNKNAVASQIQVSPYFIDEYKLASTNYSKRKVVDIISILRDYDLKSKGVDSNAVSPGDLLKEMIFKMLH